MSGQISESAPAPKTYSLFAPLALTSTLNWATLVTIGLLILLLGVYAATHAVVWRKGLLRWQRLHYRLYAAATLVGLAALIALIAVSGFGKVG